MAESAASIGELERDLGVALQKDDKALAVSLINSILWSLNDSSKAKNQQS